MKADQRIKWLLWAFICGRLYLASAMEQEDLLDFDFSDLKEIDWDYDNDNPSNEKSTLDNKQLHSNSVTFDDSVEENQVHPFDWRERILRTALSKALTNTALRQKFVEVMPILRVLTSQQRLALSALISAQINAKQGHELKLEQVRMMFGNDKKLILPIVYDIANLVRNSARKYLQFDSALVPAAELRQTQTPIDKRHFELTAAELEDEQQQQEGDSVSSPSADSSLEDFFEDMPPDVLDPQRINEALQAVAANRTDATGIANSTTPVSRSSAVTPNDPQKRSRRAAAPTEFVHKLMRSVPLSVNEDDLQKGAAGLTVKLNTTAFLQPKEGQRPQGQNPQQQHHQTQEEISGATTPSTELPMSYQEVEDLAFASLNGTEVSLSLVADSTVHRDSAEEPLPSPEELISGPRYRISGNKVRPLRPKVAAKRKRVQVRPRPKGQPPVAAALSPKKCERFTASMCIRTDDYPLDQIMGSIRRHKNAMSALLAEYHDKLTHLEFSEDFDDFSYTKQRREDEGTGGSMCQSIVRYARPQKARSAAGEWKYIVNTGQHTQTLRLEKCSNPQESCSYLAQNYRSHCAQVYNYHRLLSWDKTRGLHVDIFKVPTCCSCQVDGYRQQFPPLTPMKSKDFTPAYNADTYSTINEELDYNDDEDEDNISYQFSNGFAQHKPHGGGYDVNELQSGSNSVRSKVYPPSPTVGSYLSPPGSEDYDSNYSHKYAQRHAATASVSISAKNLLGHVVRRRPYKSLSAAAANEARVDLDISPSETHTDKEVNLFGTLPAGDKRRVPQQKRKRIYSVPHTAISTVTTNAASTVTAAPTRSSAGSSNTAFAHQTPAANPSYFTPSAANNIIVGGGSANGGLAKPKSRFHPPLTIAPATPTSTESTYRYQPSSAVPPIYHHVNSVYSSKYNSTSGVSAPGPKRINYSYHPIIDFFETNKRPSANVNSPNSANSAADNEAISPNSELLFPYKIPKSSPVGVSVFQSRERRIGFGAGGGHSVDTNAWRPVVVEP